VVRQTGADLSDIGSVGDQIAQHEATSVEQSGPPLLGEQQLLDGGPRREPSDEQHHANSEHGAA
jgi:hypothetical protein